MLYLPSTKKLYCFPYQVFVSKNEINKCRNILHPFYIGFLLLHYFFRTTLFSTVIVKMFHQKTGNFFELMQRMAKYDPVLKEHCLKLEKLTGGSKNVPSYLSKRIQNKFIFSLGEQGKNDCRYKKGQIFLTTVPITVDLTK